MPTNERMTCRAPDDGRAVSTCAIHGVGVKDMLRMVRNSCSTDPSNNEDVSHNAKLGIAE